MLSSHHEFYGNPSLSPRMPKSRTRSLGWSLSRLTIQASMDWFREGKISTGKAWSVFWTKKKVVSCWCVELGPGVCWIWKCLKTWKVSKKWKSAELWWSSRIFGVKNRCQSCPKVKAIMWCTHVLTNGNMGVYPGPLLFHDQKCPTCC